MQSEPVDGYEAARIANLLHFASLTPTQRVEWLTEMLDLLETLGPRRVVEQAGTRNARGSC